MDELRVPLEYSLLRRASHWVPGVIDVVDAFDLGSSFAIVMERLEPGKDLLDLVAQEGPLHEALAHCYFTQIVNAVIGCFRAGILHRDLKVRTRKISNFFINIFFFIIRPKISWSMQKLALSSSSISDVPLTKELLTQK